MIVVIHTNWRHLVALTAGPVIITGKWFQRLSDVEKEAAIAHEEGHIRHWHALKRIWWVMSFQWRGIEQRCREQEHEADAYAVECGCAAGLISLLIRLRDIKGPLHPSRDERIAHIRRSLSDGKRLSVSPSR